MRKLHGSRWATIGFLAAGLLGLTVTSASAAVQYNTPPPNYAFIVGPGCGTGSSGYWDTHGTWNPAGGDYVGPVQYNWPSAAGSCNGTSEYILDQATPTALFRWHFLDDRPVPSNCQIYAYIPTDHAGDLDARYDFYADDGNGGLTWLSWPGATIDQEHNSGWTHIGGAIVPAGTRQLTVILNNGDATNPGWYAGAGDMAFNCTNA